MKVSAIGQKMEALKDDIIKAMIASLKDGETEESFGEDLGQRFIDESGIKELVKAFLRECYDRAVIEYLPEHFFISNPNISPSEIDVRVERDKKSGFYNLCFELKAVDTERAKEIYALICGTIIGLAHSKNMISQIDKVFLFMGDDKNWSRLSDFKDYTFLEGGSKNIDDVKKVYETIVDISSRFKDWPPVE